MKNLRIFLTALLVISAFPLAAQVDRPELESAGEVQFQNYQGPHSRIDTVEEIIGIGTILSRRDASGEGRYFDKYRVVHVYDSQETRLFSADIFILEPNAGVDHIDNLRRILSGYLTGAYGYSAQDAAVLARFITYYNAIYRGNLNFFEGRYTPGVLSRLDAGRVGLSTQWSEWAGKTQMIIPLSRRPGQEESRLDTDALTSPEVVESLRQEPDRGLDDRKAITEIKEEEIQQEEQALAQERRETEAREAETARQQEEIRRREEEVTAQEQAAQTPEQQTEAAGRRAQLEEDRAELIQARTDLAQDRRELARREEQQDQRLEQIRREREQIAADEQGILSQGAAPSQPQGGTPGERAAAPFLLLSDQADVLGTLVMVDLTSGEVIRSSGLATIRGSSYLASQGGYLVIAGEESGDRIISLVRLNAESLQIEEQGEVSVAPNSRLLVQGNDIYGCVRYQDRWIPGRFNQALELTGLLDQEMAPYSFLSLQGQNFLFQLPSGSVKVAPLSEFRAP
ncbi:MAG: hypothetical protein LBQ61_08200 [Spirochaetales bacterium]|jgi:hypothetical protein|nr:hypothetical protein [Spirochaetales bacterium]